MSITRDRELADLLYNSVNHLNQLQADLNTLNGHIEGQKMALSLVEHKSGSLDQQQIAPESTPEVKALEDALKKVALLLRQQEHLITLLLQNHTDSTSIMNEFEKIRTAKLLSSETFTLAHLIPMGSK